MERLNYTNTRVLVRIWDRDGRLVYAEVARAVLKHRLLPERYTVTMPDSDLGEVPEGGSIDFQSLVSVE